MSERAMNQLAQWAARVWAWLNAERTFKAKHPNGGQCFICAALASKGEWRCRECIGDEAAAP